MKKPAENAKEAEEERRLQLSGTFRTADFMIWLITHMLI
jgi:hypothetical protein